MDGIYDTYRRGYGLSLGMDRANQLAALLNVLDEHQHTNPVQSTSIILSRFSRPLTILTTESRGMLTVLAGFPSSSLTPNVGVDKRKHSFLVMFTPSLVRTRRGTYCRSIDRPVPSGLDRIDVAVSLQSSCKCGVCLTWRLDLCSVEN
jgi:hypothetical protein